MPKVKPTDDVLAAALASINQDFGDGSVLLLDDAEAMDVVAISSGSMNLDEALGIGGYPEGRIVEIAGNESSGKTTLALHAIAEAHKKGGMCAFVDAEHSLDPKYAEAIGCDLKRIVISQPDNGEQGLEIANRLIATGEFAVVVIDSVAALTPKTEIEGEMGDANVGKHARLMSQAMRKMVANIKDTHTVLILINQIREKIGVMYGPNTTTTGGRAIKFFASVRLDISRIQTLKDKEVAVGNRTRVKVVKNKVASPHKVAEFDITYGIGINRTAELLDLSVDHGVIKKSGAWYSYKGDNIGQGKVAAVDFLNETTETYDSVKADLNRLREK